MNNKILSLQGGSNMIYNSSLMITMGKLIKVEPKIRNQYTNGNFVTYAEYDRIIRKLKLQEITNNNTNE